MTQPTPETSPLHGKAIVNTRAIHQAGELDALLLAHGAHPISYPCLKITPPADPAPLDTAIEQAVQGRFDWLVLTSANTVYALAERLSVLGYSRRALAQQAGLRVAAVGEKTAQYASETLGLKNHLVPDKFIAQDLAHALQEQTDLMQARVWLPQSAIAESNLAQILSTAGAQISAMPAYETHIGQGGVDIVPLFSQLTAISFTSGSTVRNFLHRFSAEGGTFDQLKHLIVVCIGPSTAKVATDEGFHVHVAPTEHTLAGMVSALADYCAHHLMQLK
jgi:uroporphyrinogen-III synthase